jgi:hypothetical protein
LAIDRPRVLEVFERVLRAAVAELRPLDRLRLALYHVHGLTLAQIGRQTREHESSVSRKIARARAAVRDAVERRLREDHGFGDADLRQCYEEAGRLGTLEVGSVLQADRVPRVLTKGEVK